MADSTYYIPFLMTYNTQAIQYTGEESARQLNLALTRSCPPLSHPRQRVGPAAEPGPHPLPAPFLTPGKESARQLNLALTRSRPPFLIPGKESARQLNLALTCSRPPSSPQAKNRPGS